MILHCTACWWKLNSLLHVHCLLVEAAFLTIHAGDGCDNLSKLHDFTLHRLLVEAKFPKHEFMYMKVGRGNLKWALICPWDRVGS